MLGFYLTLIDTEEEKSRFEELYLLYRQDMYKTAYGILQNVYDAEDAVHEAFLIVVNKMNKIGEIKCPQTHAYLIIIVKNIALKLYNDRKKIRTEDIDEMELGDQSDIENDVIDKIQQERLEKLLGLLPESYYHVLMLELLMGFSIKDISEALEITYENAKKRLQRAKSRLRKMIEDDIHADQNTESI